MSIKTMKYSSIIEDRDEGLRKLIDRYNHNFLIKNYDKDTGNVKIDDYGITMKFTPENPKYSEISNIFNDIMFEKMLSEGYIFIDNGYNVVLTDKGKEYIKEEE